MSEELNDLAKSFLKCCLIVLYKKIHLIDPEKEIDDLISGISNNILDKVKALYKENLALFDILNDTDDLPDDIEVILRGCDDITCNMHAEINTELMCFHEDEAQKRRKKYILKFIVDRLNHVLEFIEWNKRKVQHL